MKSEFQVQALKVVLQSIIAKTVEGGAKAPFDPSQLPILYAIHNATCFILEDGSQSADAFAANLTAFQEWAIHTAIEKANDN